MVNQGEVLLKACRKTGISPSKLAKELHLTREYVYALFKKPFISSEIIADASVILDIAPAEFFDPAPPYTVLIVKGKVSKKLLDLNVVFIYP